MKIKKQNIEEKPIEPVVEDVDMAEIEAMEENGMFEVLPKKEVIGLKKEYEKLNKVLCGIRNMDRLPNALIIVDPKKEINAIIHPIVKDIITKKIQSSNKRIIFISVPLLFEAKYEDICDEIICINVDNETQINRLTNRNNISIDDAKNRIASQMPLKEKCQKSNHIIDNS